MGIGDGESLATATSRISIHNIVLIASKSKEIRSAVNSFGINELKDSQDDCSIPNLICIVVKEQNIIDKR